MSEQFQPYQMQRRAAAAVSCHGLDHAGSLRKAAGSGGGRMGAVCCPARRPSRLLLEDRSSLLPAVAAVRRPVICTATTVVVQVRPFSRHLAFLAARSEPLNREHRWSRTIHSLQWPLLQCQCPVTAVSPRSATQPVMPRYRVLLPVPHCVDALQASVN